jgi:two-component system, NtrC family, nitrogen regulation sensor histidine kinase GlnL
MNPDSEPCQRPDLSLVDALTTAVILLDRKLRLVQVNAAAQSLFAISETKLKEHSLQEVLPGVDELLDAARRALAEGRSFAERDLELHGTRFDTVTVGYTVTPLWYGRSEPDFVVIEMTEFDKHQRIQTEGNMSMQNNVTSALLQGIAHEIKNPLGGIRGAAQLLERELEDQKQAEYTQIIIGEADRLRSLVDRMLGPRGESFKQLLNIHDVLEHVRQIVEAECESSADLIRDYDPSLPDVYADRDQLIQAFLNLVRNAVQAVKDGGESVVLRTRVQRQFTIGSKVHRLVVRAQVIDSGPGVDREIASSIFIPLVSGRPGGSGLGLPIAHSLVQRQGGLIGFESEPGHTEFSVWLPVGEPK